MKIEFKDDGRVIIELGPFEAAGTYPLSSTGNSRMVDGTGGFQQVGNAPRGLKVDAKLIMVIPKGERNK